MQDLSQYMFYIIGLLAIISAICVVASKNPVHSVLFLIVTFFSISGEYLLLNAQFLAIVNIMVYAGAIMVLFLFVIMLFNLNKDTEPHKNPFIKFSAVITGGLLFLVLTAALKGANNLTMAQGNNTIGYIDNLGKVLFNQFILPFEVSAVLFLAAMVGAVMLGKKEIK